MTIRTATAIAVGLFALPLLGTSAHAASIEGKWRTQAGANAVIAKCGGAFCLNITSGQYKGQRIGRVSGSGSIYKGSVTDPANGKTYSGTAKVNGRSMKLSGCVARVLCKSQTWSRR